MLNDKQHGFLPAKSCDTQMLYFHESVILNLNNNVQTDVVYFDFSKAFDSVNHDIILHKLIYLYGIDGRLLKFLKNYLSGRNQCVVIDGFKSSMKPVLSGVPQGSIIGPILFVLFINDLPQGISPGTNIALYADDTKIWRSIKTNFDFEELQKDINYLHTWSINNKMNFNIKKCKVVSINNKPSPLAMLPFIANHYYLAENLLSYADSERDLGVDINISLNFNEQCIRLLAKANQQYGLLKRTCHFVTNMKRRRLLYLSLARSQFEHCSNVWRPNGTAILDKFENFQKKCIKWILCEDELSYHSKYTYHIKCRQVDILPLSYRFRVNDMILFHQIVYRLIPVPMSGYLTQYNGNTRLRTTHLDDLSYVSSLVHGTSSITNLNMSFFFRTHSQ